MTSRLRYWFHRLASGAPSKAPSISALQAKRALVEGSALLVDVRERDEIAEGIASPARWIATSEIEADGAEWKAFVSSLPREKQIIVYCAAGVRAGRVAARLEALGFRAENLGGFSEWRAAGLPVSQQNRS